MKSLRIVYRFVLCCQVLWLANCSAPHPPISDGMKYGGVLSLSALASLENLDPPKILFRTDLKVAALVYEGLMRISEEGSPEPALARKMEVFDKGSRYRFTIRDSVYFHDDPCFPGGRGRQLTGRDVLACFQRMAAASTQSPQAYLFSQKILGFDDYAQGRKSKTDGSIWFGSEWMLNTTTTHTYDGSSRVQEEVTQTLNFMTFQMENSSKVTYAYNGHGDLSQTIQQIWLGGDWNNLLKRTVTCNGSYQIVTDLMEQWLNEVWTSYTRSTTSYAGGKASETVMENWYDNAWEKNIRLRYEYGTTAVEDEIAMPGGFVLSNYPNPFNPETMISFEMPSSGTVNLAVYDIYGRKIRSLLTEAPVAAGVHERIWNGRDEQNQTVPSGVYVYRLTSGNKIMTGRCLLLK